MVQLMKISGSLKDMWETFLCLHWEKFSKVHLLPFLRNAWVVYSSRGFPHSPQESLPLCLQLEGISLSGISGTWWPPREYCLMCFLLIICLLGTFNPVNSKLSWCRNASPVFNFYISHWAYRGVMNIRGVKTLVKSFETQRMQKVNILNTKTRDIFQKR